MTVGEVLPEIAGAYAMPAEAAEIFARKGHVKLAGVFGRSTIAAYRPHIARAVHDGRSTNSGVNLNLWTRDAIVRQFVLNPALGRIAAELLGVDAVRVFRDEPYFNKPGGPGTPWHQDGPFLPLDTDRILTIWIPLMELEPVHAPMQYIDGSHRAGPLGVSAPGERAMDQFEAALRVEGFKAGTYGYFAPGDIAVHHGWTLHSARTNRSQETREVLIIIYFADGAHVIEPPRAPGVPTLASLLPGMQPGDLAASDLTPLVYRSAS